MLEKWYSFTKLSQPVSAAEDDIGETKHEKFIQRERNKCLANINIMRCHLIIQL